MMRRDQSSTGWRALATLMYSDTNLHSFLRDFLIRFVELETAYAL